MKKTIAAISASVLGLGAAVSAGAISAQAVTPLPNCTTASGHTVETANPDPSAGDWYMGCIPQYGMGKAEFTITTSAADPFPSGYSLTDGKQTVSGDSPSASEVAHYFGTTFWASHNSITGYAKAPKYAGAFMNLDLTGKSSTSQTYGHDSSADNVGQSVAYRITSVGKAASLPADCLVGGALYQGEYEVQYAPTTTTFVETLKSIKRSVTVTYTPSPLFLGLNFDITGDDDESGGFDTTMPMCASSGGDTVQAASADADNESWYGVAELAATNDASVVTTLVPQPSEEAGPPATPPLGTFAVTSVPVLATTGVDPTPLGLAGGGLLVAGIGAYFVGRRRRRTATAR